ncbi:MAG: alpha/beta hydrolase [Pseudomonadota bacterium]
MTFSARRTLSSDNVSLYYRDYAAKCPSVDVGIPVLCLPGLTRSSKDFEVLAEQLSERHRVLCPDLRGRGESGYAADPMTYIPLQYVKDIGVVLADADVKRVAIVGTSLGGILAMTMAGLMRHQVAGVVLNDIGPDIDPKGVARIQGYVGKGGPVATWEEAINAAKEINAAAFPDYTPAQWKTMAHALYVEKDGLIAPNYDPNIAKPFAAGASTPSPSMWPFYESLIGLPLLIIRGETSDILARKTADDMMQRHGASDYVEVPNIGHAPALTEPGIAAHIARFMGNIPAQQGVIANMTSRLRSVKELTRITKALKHS